MSELVDDLLDVSRVTRGLIEITREPVDLHGVVHAALEQARPLVEARRHHVALDLPPGEVVVDGDRTRLVQVLVNLVANAAKYTPPGGSIHVSLSLAGTRARIDVVDDGVGIDAPLLPHVFELFTQGARTPDRSQGGLGIGLALVKALVELHQGEVVAESEGQGRGSRFSVLLPLAAPDHAPAEAPALAAVPTSCLRILVTDDNVDAADSLAALLRSQGHEVVVAYSGGEGLAAIDRGVPDVCILDLGLPDITGLDLARELRGRPALARTKLVALTGYGQPQDRQATHDAGFDEHLVKPMRPAELEALLARHARARDDRAGA
jgi:CheY-like chemotaxis protein/two-component sensor histidine kinase